MKKPYLNKDGRFILTTDTLVGNWLKAHIAWKRALRDFKNGNKFQRFLYKHLL